jgi:hypothetical protein
VAAGTFSAPFLLGNSLRQECGHDSGRYSSQGSFSHFRGFAAGPSDSDEQQQVQREDADPKQKAAPLSQDVVYLGPLSETHKLLKVGALAVVRTGVFMIFLLGHHGMLSLVWDTCSRMSIAFDQPCMQP